MVNIDTLPAFIRSRLEGRATLRQAFDNSFWLFCDQLLRMAAGLLVGVWVTRYLGPENYGWFSYALATVGVATSLTSFGVGAVVVRELVRGPAETAAWMGAAFSVRAVGAALGFLACVVVAWRHSGRDGPGDELLLVVASGMLLQTIDVVDLLFQARGESRRSAWIRMSGCVFGSAIRVALILVHAPLIAFATAGVAELAFTAVGWLRATRKAGSWISTWSCNRTQLVGLLCESWPLALLGLAITAQAYSDQLVIGALLGAEELGQYAAALRLVSIFAFVPMVIQTVAAPEIVRAKRDDESLYQRRLHSLYRLMFALFVAMAVPLVVLGPMAARWLYGASYAGAAGLLPWLALRLFFTNLGVARSVFITSDGLLRFALFTAIAGAVVNIALNIVLVPRWGSKGAIIASFASFTVTTFALESFDKRARANLVLMARAVFMPWRGFA
jgi:O-antigen/teichoic acid export membrane protein